MVVSMRESFMYFFHLISSSVSDAEPGYPPKYMNLSKDQPNASLISLNDQWGILIISNLPARLSVRPVWTNRGDEPKRKTFNEISFILSSSHRRFTVSDQPSIFWISSNMISASPFPFAFSLPRSQFCSIQMRSWMAGSSAK